MSFSWSYASTADHLFSPTSFQPTPLLPCPRAWSHHSSADGTAYISEHEREADMWHILQDAGDEDADDEDADDDNSDDDDNDEDTDNDHDDDDDDEDDYSENSVLKVIPFWYYSENNLLKVIPL